MKRTELIDDALRSYKKGDIDLESARDIILFVVREFIEAHESVPKGEKHDN